jgi:kynureninase
VTLAPEDLRRSPNPLAVDYSAFRVGERLLLTGHSHQAWPDVAREGQVEAFEDAALCVDDKWERAFERAERVRDGFRALLHEPGAELALAQNTHELVTRMLSALDLARRPRLVASDGEFHTLRRQLARLAEQGIEVVRVRAQPADTLAERIAAALDDRTSAALVSAVLFETAHVVPGLGELARACAAHGAELVVDVYHALGPVGFDVAASGLQDAWVVGGGYKYLQLGEGNCFMRLPPHAEQLRPVLTGWFAEFGTLAGHHDSAVVEYGPGAARFAGATYDPTSHYRAARVLRFHAERGLSAPLLQASYRHQVGLLAARFDALGLAPELIDRDRETPPERTGGFLALRTTRAGALQRRLAELGVQTDSRADYLRLGPAPYLSDAQLEEAVERLGEAARAG